MASHGYLADDITNSIHPRKYSGKGNAIHYSTHVFHTHQSGRSPKVVALFSATDFSSYIIELLQLFGKFKLNEIMDESTII